MTVNIITDRRLHEKYCHNYVLSDIEGDVRRCRHGRLQVVKNVSRGWPVATYGWVDVFGPITYYRAKKALREEDR